MEGKYRLIALDLDGTLTNSKKELSERNKKALIQAQEDGAQVILASGRPTYGIVPLAQELNIDEFDGYILSFNGAQIINWKSGEVVFSQVLDRDLLPILYKHSKEAGVTLLTYDNEVIVTENSDDQYVKFEAHLNKMEVKQVDSLLDYITYDVTKCLAVGDPAILVELEEQLKREIGDRMNIYRSEPFFLELVPLNIDKANSLDHLLSKLKREKEELIAFGDGYNDLSMIEYAGTGVAMENAQDAVKEVANLITLTNDQDGVAHIIEQLKFRVN